MTLPIVERELRVASRQRKTYWARFGAALIALIIAGQVLSSWGGGKQAEQAKAIFSVLVGSSFIFCLFAGSALTADSISEEKREGTLGLLFLTSLKGHDVILGKLAAQSLHAAYGLISIFPVMAIAFLLGGIEPGELARMTLLLLNTMFFSLAIGTLVSTLSQFENRSRIVAFLCIAAVTFALPALAHANASLERLFGRLAYLASPFFAVRSGMSGIYHLDRSAFWINQAVLQVVAWSCLGLASFLVQRIWQEKGSAFWSSPFRLKLKEWKLGSAQEQTHFRRSLLDKNPLVWLSNRSRFNRWRPAAFVILCAAFYSWGFLRWPEDVLDDGFIMLGGMTVNVIFKVWISLESVRLFSEGKRSGALDLIVSTPMTTAEIVFGYWKGMVYQFRWGIVLLIAGDLFLVTISSNTSPEWFFTCLAGIALLVLDMASIAWLGMWLSLTRKSVTAIGSIFFYILILPWVLFFGLMISQSGRGSTSGEAITAFFVISILIDIIFYQWSSLSLKNEFRKVVALRFSQKEKK
jgi:ABC-type transport system involved in multi-copper enzyme maturation permease subunit